MSLHRPETLRRYHHYRKKDDLIVIKYGAEWCRPCKALIPMLETFAKEHRHVYFLDVDVENEEIADHDDLKNIGSIPHVKFYINKELKREVVGANKDQIKKYVERYSLFLKTAETDKTNETEKTDETEKTVCN